MWTLSTEDLQVFSYTVNNPGLPNLCRNWAQYQNYLKNLFECSHPMLRKWKNCPSVPRDFFAAIEEKDMHLYDFHTLDSTPSHALR